MQAKLLAIRLKTRREASGLTMGQLATYSGVSKGWISQLEHALIEGPSLQKVGQLAEQLGCTVDELRGADGTADIDSASIDLAFQRAKKVLSPRDLRALERLIIASTESATEDPDVDLATK